MHDLYEYETKGKTDGKKGGIYKWKKNKDSLAR
jgi:hypothetical protein